MKKIQSMLMLATVIAAPMPYANAVPMAAEAPLSAADNLPECPDPATLGDANAPRLRAGHKARPRHHGVSHAVHKAAAQAKPAGQAVHHAPSAVHPSAKAHVAHKPGNGSVHHVAVHRPKLTLKAKPSVAGPKPAPAAAPSPVHSLIGAPTPAPTGVTTRVFHLAGKAMRCVVRKHPLIPGAQPATGQAVVPGAGRGAAGAVTGSNAGSAAIVPAIGATAGSAAAVQGAAGGGSAAAATAGGAAAGAAGGVGAATAGVTALSVPMVATGVAAAAAAGTVLTKAAQPKSH